WHPDIAEVDVPSDTRFPSPVEGLMLEEEHGIIILVGGEERVEGILRCARVERLEAGHREENRLEFLRMKRAKGETAAAGQAHHEGAFRAGAEMHRGRIQRELGECFGGKVGELELRDRPVAVEREANGPAGTPAFGERRIEDARTTEILEQPFGDLE